MTTDLSAPPFAIGEWKEDEDPQNSGSFLKGHWLGQEFNISDVDNRVDTGSILITAAQEASAQVRLVRNTSGGTLAAGAAVTYGTNAGDHGKNIGAVAADGAQIDGFVDPFIGTAVADDALFYIYIKGVFRYALSNNSILAVGDDIVGAGSGQVKAGTIAAGGLDIKSNFAGTPDAGAAFEVIIGANRTS